MNGSETTINRLFPHPASASAGVCGGIRAQYANEPVAAPEFRVDEIAIRGQCFAQGGDLNLEAPFRHSTVRPHPSEKLFFCEEHAICLEQDQKEVEGARTEHDWNAVGEQPPPA